MSRSRKRVAGGTNVVCKSQKKGKQLCHRKFRRNGTLHKMLEAVNQWDLGGDGKSVYTWDSKSEEYKKYTRK